MAAIRFDFMDVGQGDGTLITCPDNTTILFDFGSKKNAQIAGTDAITFLVNWLEDLRKKRHLANAKIDYIMLSHGDGDHYNLIPPLFQAYSKAGKTLDIGQLVIGGREKDYSGKIKQLLFTPAKNSGSLVQFGNKVHDPAGAPRWQFAGNTVKIHLLSANYPSKNSSDKNAKSLVIRVSYGGKNVILTGDAEKKTEKAIIGYYNATPNFLNAVMLKLGHHGSQAGTSVDWLDEVEPPSVVASSDMRWAHPYCVTVNRVQNNTTLWQKYKHHWLCGQGSGAGKHYTNSNTNVGVYTSIAYITTQNQQIGGVWYPPGYVAGVQYAFEIYNNGDLQIFDTFGNDSGRFSWP